jgi:hypothetical protein
MDRAVGVASAIVAGAILGLAFHRSGRWQAILERELALLLVVLTLVNLYVGAPSRYIPSSLKRAFGASGSSYHLGAAAYAGLALSVALASVAVLTASASGAGGREPS